MSYDILDVETNTEFQENCLQYLTTEVDHMTF